MLGPASFFVRGVARVEEGRDCIGGEDGGEFGGGQRLPRVIAFDHFDVVGCRQFAQETPGVATGGSGAFVPKVHHIHCGFSSG